MMRSVNRNEEVNMLNLLTEREVAKQIKVSLASLRKWRLERRGPQFVKVGALVRYRSEDLEEWLATLPKGGALLSANAAGLTVMRAGH
jgi:excisionase family DNA binding protein